jgi:hypothetical protein
MLCTKCSEVVKPVVAIDIDGTLGNYHKHFLDFAQSYLGVSIPSWECSQYNGVESFRDWTCKLFGIDQATWYQIKLAYRQGGMKRTMPVTFDARLFTKRIRDLNAELWLTTSRPYNRLDNIDPDTREWLRRNHIDFDHLLYDDDKYQLLSELVDKRRVVMVLDDLGEMYDAAESVFFPGVAVLKRNWWNSGVHRPNVISYLLTEGQIEVEKRVNNWKEYWGD